MASRHTTHTEDVHDIAVRLLAALVQRDDIAHSKNNMSTYVDTAYTLARMMMQQRNHPTRRDE